MCSDDGLSGMILERASKMDQALIKQDQVQSANEYDAKVKFQKSFLAPKFLQKNFKEIRVLSKNHI